MKEKHRRPTVTINLNAASHGQVLIDGQEMPADKVSVHAQVGRATRVYLRLVGVNVDVEASADVEQLPG